MSRFFSMIWRLEALDAEWTVLSLAGAWIFPKYAKIVATHVVASMLCFT